MSAAQSITAWINDVKMGDQQAAQQLWNHYFTLLVQRAYQKLAGQPGRNEEAEDAALSAFKSFCVKAEEGCYPDLSDREGLWRLLMTITVSKANQSIRRRNAQKRRLEMTAADVCANDGNDADDVMLRVEDDEPTPDIVASAIEQCQNLLAKLGDDDVGRKRQQVALLKLEQHTNREIGDQLNCSERTIERHLELIRRIWNEAIPRS